MLGVTQLFEADAKPKLCLRNESVYQRKHFCIIKTN